MKNNIVDFQRIRDEMSEHKKSVANDAAYSTSNGSFKISHQLTPVRYVLAILLYVIVVIPLGIMAALRLLFQILGGIAVMGLTIVWFMGADVSGYAVLAAWFVLSLVGCANELFTWWTESRFPFRLFGIGKSDSD